MLPRHFWYPAHCDAPVFFPFIFPLFLSCLTLLFLFYFIGSVSRKTLMMVAPTLRYMPHFCTTISLSALIFLSSLHVSGNVEGEVILWHFIGSLSRKTLIWIDSSEDFAIALILHLYSSLYVSGNVEGKAMGSYHVRLWYEWTAVKYLRYLPPFNTICFSILVFIFFISIVLFCFYSGRGKERCCVHITQKYRRIYDMYHNLTWWSAFPSVSFLPSFLPFTCLRMWKLRHWVRITQDSNMNK